ncbi:uncharacterized protein LOC112460590, partial [Temnothorax curvispinosus]|uniref:Uncharacterized protein LOC112460590 n=1 Tax=Temnothorax curvispinosus TaxID=300111 RepID=A0A6J1QFI8_9HYME
QTQTVEEHFKLILEDNSVIDPNLRDVTSNDLPAWYNKNIYKGAQNYYKRNSLSIVAASTVGLIIVFAVETILKVLLCTKRSSSTCLAFKRYVETLQHLYNISTCDPADTNSKYLMAM